MAMVICCYYLWHGYMLVKSQAIVIVAFVSEETKFEVDTTSIILSYHFNYHFENVNKVFFRYY